MRDAIRMSIDYLKENGKKDKKVLVVVTDGDDNNSSIGVPRLALEQKHRVWDRRRVGSLAEAALRHCPCPVWK